MKIIQMPNPPLLIALIGWLISVFLKGTVSKIGQTMFFVAILVWAYEELTKGANWFRKILGGVVLLVVSVSLFNQIQ